MPYRNVLYLSLCLSVVLSQGEALPIDIRMLADMAERCHSYAKALHYKVLHHSTQL